MGNVNLSVMMSAAMTVKHAVKILNAATVTNVVTVLRVHVSMREAPVQMVANVVTAPAVLLVIVV